MGASMKTWVGGAVALCVAILAGGWFLLVSPQRATADEVRSQTASNESQNADLTTQVASLKKKFETIDALKARLAAASATIPADAQLAELVNELNTAASSSGATILAVTPAPAQTVVLVSPEAKAVTAGASKAAATPSPTPSATAGTSKSAPAAGTTSASTAVPQLNGFVAIPLAVEIVGSYESTKTMLDAVQLKLTRYVLVTNVTSTQLSKTPAAQGRPSSNDGDVDMVINGYAFVLTPVASSSTGTAASGSGTTQLPPASPGRNPFLALPGTSTTR
ncbi:pilus assembly protein, PilO [mine drainage metagenome]|uniref:Pilus assembly protein, PilO n=1 Tax=mine drainage metagenome TaxID=410659 RepID=A0A1J5RBI1_9ZZZZ